jgi:hypothetical protein
LTVRDNADEAQGFLGIKCAMDIHVAPGMKVEYLAGDFRRPLPPASESMVETLQKDLKEVFEFENSL